MDGDLVRGVCATWFGVVRVDAAVCAGSGPVRRAVRALVWTWRAGIDRSAHSGDDCVRDNCWIAGGNFDLFPVDIYDVVHADCGGRGDRAVDAGAHERNLAVDWTHGAGIIGDTCCWGFAVFGRMGEVRGDAVGNGRDFAGDLS